MPTATSSPPKLIFVVGGVSSSLGKGITTASLGRLLVDGGVRARPMKLDPYLCLDAGVLAPQEHGECWVTNDGRECDLDLGHYERYVGTELPGACSVTAGTVYWNVLSATRRGALLGQTVQVVPHITNEIKRLVLLAAESDPPAEVLVVEVGGTIGDMEILPFLEAIRQLRTELPAGDVALVQLTLVPEVGPNHEQKTKPSQHSVQELRRHGLFPDLLLCRSSNPIDEALRRKLSLTCGVGIERVIPVPDLPRYGVPAWLREQHADVLLADILKLKLHRRRSAWQQAAKRLAAPSGRSLTVGLVAKYLDGHDTYLSVHEALSHAAATTKTRVQVQLLDAESPTLSEQLAQLDAVVVPGGFGSRGVEGKVEVASLARRTGLPYLGLCLGLQVAVVALARDLAGIPDAVSSEWGVPGTPVVDLLETQRTVVDLGGSMRLGDYPTVLIPGTATAQWYGVPLGDTIVERHRHRYEVSQTYLRQLQAAGLCVSGTSPQADLVECIEVPRHPFYIATQAHPEFRSRPDRPHPLFVGLLTVAKGTRRVPVTPMSAATPAPTASAVG